MLKWAAILLVIALVAAPFGFTGIASDWRELFFLPRLPRLQHVFLAQLTFVADQRELQCVISPLEFINTRTFATFRFHAASALERGLVALHSVGSPSITSSMMLKIDIEGAVGLDRPNCAERIRPSSDQCGLSALLEHGASGKQRESSCGHNDSERDLVLHGAMLS